MSFPSWLRDLPRQLLAPRLGAAQHRRIRNTSRTRFLVRPNLERLEDRITPTGPTLTTLASGGTTAGLIVDGNGNLYGTSYGGIFELAKGRNTTTTLASFNANNYDNEPPLASLLMDSNGNLYGTTQNGGPSNDGTVFELAKGSNTLTTLASFSGYNGANPYAGLIMDGNGNLYGTTLKGGPSGQGTVFEVAQGSGTITTLAHFSGFNGEEPYASLIADGSGNLYGTTSGGGAFGEGTVFELAKGSNTISTLASLNETGNGAQPYGNLVMDSSGNLYGTARYSGSPYGGTIFELAKGSNTLTTLVSFDGRNGFDPFSGLAIDSNGNLYGTTEFGGSSGDGTVFELPQGSSTLLTLVSFTTGSDGGNLYAGLAMDSSGNLYGTALEGGPSGQGTIFEVQGAGSGTLDITSQPSSQTVNALSNVSFQASASGNPTPTVQWQVRTDGGSHWSNVSGATNPTLTLNDVRVAQSGEYTAVFTNSAGSATTLPVTLTVNSASTTVTAANATASFSNSARNVTLTANVTSNVGPVNEGTVTFTLLQGSNTIGTATTSNTVHNGSASVSYALPAGTPTGTYMIDVVYNPGPDFTTNSDNTHTLTIQLAPTVTTNPTSQTVIAGGNVTFTAAAEGNPAPTVKWQVSSDGGKTWTDISNATTTTLTLPNVSFSLNGNEYRAVFSSNLGSANTNAATLTVHTTPAITSGDSTVFTVGQNGSFLVTTSGFPAPTLTVSGLLPSGITFTNYGNGTASLGGTPATGTNGTYYFAVLAENGVGSGVTQNFTLTVNSVPVPPPSPPPSPPPPPNPAPPNVPFLLSLFNQFLPHTETVTANGTTITDSLFGIPLVEMYDDSGNLVSVTLFGFNITFLFV